MSNDPETWKEKGNQCFKQRNYKASIECYTKAIQLNPDCPHYYTNRSFSYYNLKQFQKAVDDSRQAIAIDPSFEKGYYRLGHSLLMLQKYREARDVFEYLCKITNHSTSSIDDFEKAQKLYIDNYFRPLSNDLEIHVKWLSKEKGRGVFSVRDCDKGSIIFFDKPLVSSRKYSRQRLNSCDYCMKVILKEEQLKPNFGSQFKLIYKDQPPTWISCEGCENSMFPVRYCSLQCKNASWNVYHQLFCASAWNQSISNQFQKILDSCTQNDVIQPLIVMRMMSKILLDTIVRKVSIEQALEPFLLFEANQTDQFLMDEVLALMNQLVEHTFGEQPKTSEVINENMFNSLKGILSRNAVSLNPVSDFHLYLNELPTIHQSVIANIHEKGLTPMEFVESEWMNGLTIHGTGLFPIGNSINHSCIPNVASACCKNDYTLGLVALRPIASGEELFISYIDENLPFDERQKLLEENYLFKCDCTKCIEKK